MALVIDAVHRHDAGDDEPLDLLARLLYEQDQAKAQLQLAGYGCTGMPWPDVVAEVMERTR